MFRWLRRPVGRRQKRAYRARMFAGKAQPNRFPRLALLGLLVAVGLLYGRVKGWW